MEIFGNREQVFADLYPYRWPISAVLLLLLAGAALIIETGPGVYVLRFEHFSVQNGPGLFVYLSTNPDGYGEGSYNMGQLKATDGSFNYDIPPGVDPWSYASVIIWCEPFAVLFATAPLV